MNEAAKMMHKLGKPCVDQGIPVVMDVVTSEDGKRKDEIRWCWCNHTISTGPPQKEPITKDNEYLVAPECGS